MTLPLATGTNNPGKQVSVDAWNNVIGKLNKSVLSSDYNTLQEAIDGVAELGGGELIVPPGSYEAATITLKSGVHIKAKGVTLTGSPRLYADTTESDFSIDGVKLVDTTENISNYLLDIRGSEFSVTNVHLEKAPDTGGVMGYIRPTSSHGVIQNIRTRGGNGIFICGHDHVVDGFNMVAGSADQDDAWKIYQTSAGGSYNITISNGVVTGYSNILAIGSEIGSLGADDATFSRYVRGVHVSNVVARECHSLIYIKPGAVDAYDYRNGLVEHITMSDCHLEDKDGVRAGHPIYITAGRGAIVRHVYITNCSAYGRAYTSTAAGANGIEITVGNLGTSATIENIFIDGFKLVDPYDGAANSGSAPGYPWYYGAYIRKASTGGVGIINRVELKNIFINGTKMAGIINGSGTGMNGPFIVQDYTGRNISNGGTSATAGSALWANTKIESRGTMDLSLSGNAFSGTRVIGGDTQTTITYVGQQRMSRIGNVTAGATVTGSPFVPNKAAYVYKVEVVTAADVVANATNYVTFRVRKKGGGTLATTNTQTTGTNDNIPRSINGSNLIVGADAFIAAGGAVICEAISTGTGAATGVDFIVHYIEYGQA